MGSLIEFVDLKVIFHMGGMQVVALRGVDLDLRRGEVLGVLGESGSGKTVLIHAAFRLLPENAKVSGKILYQGKDLLSMDRRRAMRLIGQNFSLIPQGFGALNPFLKSWLQISERPMEHFGVGKEEGHRRAEFLLGTMGINQPSRTANSYRHQLSGGMLQRVLVAMGASGPSQVVFLDEPTKGLDEGMKRLVVSLLKKARERSDAMMVVSHDLGFLEEVSDRICVMYCGDILEVSKVREFFVSPRHPYSSALLNSLPSRGLKPIEGEIPSMVSPPDGCRFSPRCRQRDARCANKRPPMKAVDDVMVRCFKYA
ncbi:MAG: ABC transporter ATP-binding protein [Candidatus Verstraetearchaeota archaeon]|nr:ABC transporter ATP-binding protein [Candidatus Verstraetearchaeota archaeon]